MIVNARDVMCLSRHTLTGVMRAIAAHGHTRWAHEIQPELSCRRDIERAPRPVVRVDGERQIGTLVRRPYITSGRRASQRSMLSFRYVVHEII